MLQWDKVPLVPSPRTQELISPAKGSGFEINLQNNHKLPHFARPSVTSKPVRYKAKRDFTHTARCCFSYTNKRNQGATREQFPKASKRAAAPLKQPIKKKKKGGEGERAGTAEPRTEAAPRCSGAARRGAEAAASIFWGGRAGREGLRGTGHPDSSCSPHPLQPHCGHVKQSPGCQG